MVFGGSTRDVPDLLKPLPELFLVDATSITLTVGRLPVTAGLALHQDELYVVLDDRIRLIRFAEELRAVGDFIGGIGDFVPDDWIQIVEPNLAAEDADVSMEREYKMPAKSFPGDTHVADNADESSTRDENAEGVPPDLVQLGEKPLIVLDMSELVGVFLVAFQIPVRRRGYDKMRGFVRQE